MSDKPVTELTPNQIRLEQWRIRYRATGLYDNARAFLAQRVNGIDWDHHDADGMLRLGEDGFLPRNEG